LARPSQRCHEHFQTRTFLIITSGVVGLALHCLALSFDPGFSPLNPTVFDLFEDGSKYSGKPLVTVGTIPFGVKSDAILQQFLVSIGSWLRSSAQIVVHLYVSSAGESPAGVWVRVSPERR
jgi:hypothetical protein